MRELILVLIVVVALFGSLATFLYPDPQRSARRRARRQRV